jgi:hypothetical protein
MRPVTGVYFTGMSAAGSDPLEDCGGLPDILAWLELPGWNPEKSIPSPAALLRRRGMFWRAATG